MADPIWLLDEFILRAHERELENHGGIAGVRDHGMLESALARPKNLWAYSGESKPDPAILAAAYAFGIARNHPFLDGNKRTALVAARTFLLRSGFQLNANNEEKAEAILQLAAGELTEEAFATWLRDRLQEAIG